VLQPVAPTTAEQRLARKNELKARGTLLMALPDKHQLMFNSHKDAKILMEAIEKRFGGNTETKKVQKALLKQQFENFTGSISKGLDQIHDSLQKLVSQLEIHGVSISQEDVNLKFLRSTASQNLAFVSSTHTDSTTDSVSAAASIFAACVKLPTSPLPNVDSLYGSKMAVAMLTMLARRFPQKTGRNLGANGPTSMGFDISKVECYNCHRKGHFARDCRSPKDPRRPGAADPQRRTVPVFTKAMFDCENYYSSESDYESWPPSNLYDRFQPSGGYHAVPSPYIGTFMPSKPDLVFNTAPTAVETGHLAFNVQLSPTKTEQDLSHITIPSAPIIEDWPIKTTIPAATSILASPKSNSSGKRRNRKACFVCKSVDHLIKDCDYHTKKMAQPTPRNYAHRGHQKQYAPLTHTKPQKHMVPTAVLTQYKLVSNTNVRQISATLPNITVTRLRNAHQVFTKSKSPIRRHITRSPSSRTSKSPPRINVVQAPVVSVVQGKHGTWGNPQQALKDNGVIDSGCPRHTTGNMSYLSDFEALNGGYVAFGGNPKGGKITGKGKIMTCKLDFSDVYFVNEIKFNLFIVSQMCDKKNSVLFTNTECLVLSSDFKLPDESQALLRVPRENNMYNVNLKNIVPSRDLTCLFSKATLDESKLWHRRLAHVNFKTINKLVKGNLVRGFPTKVFENDHTCVACRKGKQHRASYSLLPIPFWAEAVNTACYVQNRVLVTKHHNKTSYELLHGRPPSIGFIRPFGCPVTILNTLDPLGKFQGKVDEGFIVRYSVCSKAFRVFNNRTRIIQATLHVNFLENKPNVAGTGPTWLFDIDSLIRKMNYQLVHAGNQTNSGAGFQANFDAKKAGDEVDQSYMLFPMWSAGSTNPRNNAKDVAFDGKEHDFDVKKPEPKVILSPSKFQDCSKNSGNEVNAASSTEVDFNNLESSIPVSPIPTTRIHKVHPVSQIIGDLSLTTQTRSMTRPVEDQEELLQFKMQKVWVLDDLPYGKRAIGTKCVYRNKKNKRGIVIRSKARLVAQGHTHEEGIDYEDVFAPVERIEAIRLFLAYASFMGFMVYQMNVKSAFLYETIEEEVYVYQPLGFEDPDHPDKVYKVVKALYGLHQAPRAWLQALVDKKKVVITEDTIRDTLCLDDAEGVDCQPNEEIFAELARMGYEKPLTKLAFYKAFFSSYLVRNVDSSSKFYMYPRFIQLIIKNQLGDLSTHTTKYISPTLTQKVFANMRRVGKGFLGVETPLFEGMIVGVIEEEGDAEEQIQDVAADTAAQGVDTAVSGDDPQPQSPPQAQPQATDFPMSLLQEALDAYAALTRRVEHLQYDKVAQALEITKVKRRVKKLEKANKVKVLKLRRLKKVGTSQRIDTSDDTVMEDASKQGRMIDALDSDASVALMDEKKAEEAKVAGDDHVQGRQAKIYKIDMDHPLKVLSMQEDEPEVQEVVDVVTTAKLITEVVTASIRVAAVSTRRRKRVVIRDPEEESTTIIPAETKSKDKGKGIMVEEPKPMKKKQQVEIDEEYARKLHEELNNNIDWDVTIDHNVVGFRLDYFKGMSYDDILPIFEAKFNSNITFLLKSKEQLKEEENRAIQSINETLAQKAAKRRKLNKEVKDLK
nr:putative ribonuclease H-like domain-containing protein [Tanacetum cinerariifolium]